MKYNLNVVGVMGAAVLLCGLSAGQAMAAPSAPVECETLLNMKIESNAQSTLYTLCMHTQETWFKNGTDRENLKGKVVVAGTKVEQGKYSDASMKLSDYETTLRALMDAPKKKIDVDRAQNVLLPDLDAAQIAVANLQ